MTERSVSRYYAEAYTRTALGYQRILERRIANGQALDRLAVVNSLTSASPDSVLDIGCGPGTLTLRLAADLPGATVIGIDVSDQMLKRLSAAAMRRGLTQCHTAMMDMQRLAFSDETFDAVVAGHSFQFSFDLSQTLGEAHRVLKTHGRLAFTVPSAARRSHAMSVLDRVAAEVLPPLVAPELPITYRALRSRPALNRLLASAGFSKIVVRRYISSTHWESPADFLAGTSCTWPLAARLKAAGRQSARLFRQRALVELEMLDRSDGLVTIHGSVVVSATK